MSAPGWFECPCGVEWWAGTPDRPVGGDAPCPLCAGRWRRRLVGALYGWGHADYQRPAWITRPLDRLGLRLSREATP